MLLSHLYDNMLYKPFMEYYSCDVFLFLQVPQCRCYPQGVIWRSTLTYKGSLFDIFLICPCLLSSFLNTIYQNRDLIITRALSFSISLLYVILGLSFIILLFRSWLQNLLIRSLASVLCLASSLQFVSSALVLLCMPMLVLLSAIGVEFAYQDHLSITSSYLHISSISM